jgi:hypothetical protein
LGGTSNHSRLFSQATGNEQNLTKKLLYINYTPAKEYACKVLERIATSLK